jgi:hypothetical protein
MSNQYFSLRGKVYIGDRDANGNPDGLIHIGNVPDCTLSLATETLEHKESMSGQDLTDVSITTSKSGELSLTTEELLKEVFSYILNGTVTDITSGTQAAGDPVCTAPKAGRIYLLSKQNVSSVVLKDHLDATISDTKYIVNAKHGSVEFTDVTGLTGAVTAAFSYGAHRHVSMFTADSMDKWFRLEGLNKITNERVVVDLYKIAINPTDGMQFISDELGNAPIKAKVLADTKKAADGVLGQFGRIVLVPTT